MKSKQRPTIRDVAREAGVSYQTVSRVINDSDHVSPHTRGRVWKAVEKLGYRPNRMAQILQTERSLTLEVVMPYFGFNRVLYDMARTAHQRGYNLVIAAIDSDEFPQALESAEARFIDGLILTPLFPFIDDYDELVRLTHGIPFVQIGAKLGAHFPSVIYDHAQGARLATQHLIDLGHRAIAEISGPLLNYDAAARHEGWQATLKDNGIPPQPCIEGDFTIEGGYQAMNDLLDSGAAFTAVFAGNDSMAFGIQTALRERGLHVPGDISIVGFDDIPESAHLVPGLTTVRQDFQLLGQLAVEYLLNLIENRDTPIYQRVLSPRLVIRGSTRPVR
ncbi:MAG: LacI family transcriptional regulator [Chloroflexi bacterium]|nr:LacI family transcriptional regulator [Chloroflexota bacterium]